jgi:hypothetical protein
MPIFAVTTARGPRWDPSRDNRAQAGWDSHAAYMDCLVEQGHIILGGPQLRDIAGQAIMRTRRM